MKPSEKEAEMDRFVRNETQIMVATTVIEVGVNVPNASVMIIENSERFGLSQLHQLRGRVGRGAEQSFCILMTGNKLTQEGKKRVKTMVETNDGFKISEVDLEIRGPGELQGTRQSGGLNLKIANLITDVKILEEVQAEVEKVKKRVENFGEINPMALEAFEEMKKRYDFIIVQKTDLENAKSSLKYWRNN